MELEQEKKKTPCSFPTADFISWGSYGSQAHGGGPVPRDGIVVQCVASGACSDQFCIGLDINFKLYVSESVF